MILEVFSQHSTDKGRPTPLAKIYLLMSASETDLPQRPLGLVLRYDNPLYCNTITSLWFTVLGWHAIAFTVKSFF